MRGPEWNQRLQRWEGGVGKTRAEAKQLHRSKGLNFRRIFPFKDEMLQGRLPPGVRLNPDQHSNDTDIGDIEVSLRELKKTRYRTYKTKRKKS